MGRNQIIDVTGTPLTPGRHGKRCLGNGLHPEYECCCDECDYMMCCYPEYDWRPRRERFLSWLKRIFWGIIEMKHAPF